MCTNYTPTARDRLQAMRLGVADLPQQDWPAEVFPGYLAPIVVAAQSGSATSAHMLLARFGLLPRWSRSAQQAREIARGTMNARSETVAEKPSFRAPWRERQRALVPMEHFYEPCWESGAAVRWRIARVDGSPMAAAGLWECWTDPANGETVSSFTLLTVNADGHALMQRMHRPGEEKRMLVLLPPSSWTDWLQASPVHAMDFMRAVPAAELTGQPAPLRPRTPRPVADPVAKGRTGDLFEPGT